MRKWLVFTRLHSRSRLLVAYDDISAVYATPEEDSSVAVTVVATKAGSHFSVEGTLEAVQLQVLQAGEQE